MAPTSSSPHLRSTSEDGVLSITLDRPDQGNALTYEMMTSLRDLFEEADEDPGVRVIRLQGAGASFSRGDDPDDLGEWPTEWEHRRPGGSHGAAPLPQQAMLTAVRNVAKPTIAQLHGDVLGLAFDLASVCDLRIAADDARIGDDRISQARHVATGVTHVLPRLVGLSQAARLLLLGEVIDAQEGARIGYLHELHPAAELSAAVDDLAARVAGMATRSYAIIKQQILEELDMPYETALMHSIAIRQTNVIEDRLEGGLAFREKRAPQFEGR